MKVHEIFDHFLSRAHWLDREQTVDKITIGDPEMDIDKCLVVWMPSFNVIRIAIDKKIRLIVAHEPTFWDHLNDIPDNQPGGAEKYRQLEQNSLAIIRLHDAWDRWPDIGIPWAWARFLDLDGEPTTIGNRSFQHRYDITPIPFGEFAKRVASKTAQIGEPCIETIGETNKLVSRIGIGTGCYCSIFSYIKMGCDCCIVCDDGAKYWQEIQYAEDMGISVICVNHATSEEPGIITLTDYINKHLNQVSATYLAQGCRYVYICA